MEGARGRPIPTPWYFFAASATPADSGEDGLLLLSEPYASSTETFGIVDAPISEILIEGGRNLGIELLVGGGVGDNLSVSSGVEIVTLGGESEGGVGVFGGLGMRGV